MSDEQLYLDRVWPRGEVELDLPWLSGFQGWRLSVSILELFLAW